MSKRETWRDKARPIIAEVLLEHAGEDEKEIRSALRDAYPWFERKYWPYKVWCDEIRRQMNKKESPQVIAAREAGQIDWC